MLFLLTALAQAAAAQAFYTVTNIGSLGSAGATGAALNDAGWIVGQSGSEGYPNTLHAFLWKPGAGMVDIIPGGDVSFARGINNVGHVVGSRQTPDQPGTAFIWDGTSLEALPFPPDAVHAWGVAISDSGAVAGTCIRDGQYRAFVHEGGLSRELPSDRWNAEARAMNRGGIVAGWSKGIATVWSGGVQRQLGLLPGGKGSDAYDINTAGHVVGESGSIAFANHAIRWSEAEGMRDLGVAVGDTSSRAMAINDRGQIVGSSWNSVTGVRRAVIWAAGKAVSLESLVPADSGVTLTEAVDVNNAGQVLVNGRVGETPAAFLLTPSGSPALLFRTPPAEAFRDAKWTVAPEVCVLKADGTIDTSFNGNVTVALEPGTYLSGAYLSGTKIVAAVNGVARFPGLSLNKVGRFYQLTASTATGLTVQSPVFRIGLPRIHVRQGASDTMDGSTWSLAKGTIAGGLSATGRIDATEVWVKYGDWDGPITMPAGAKLIGGFAGTETSRDQRQPRNYVTRLRRPITDEGFIITFAPRDTGAVLDGFTLTYSTGGLLKVDGVWIPSGSPVIRNNVFATLDRAVQASETWQGVYEDNLFNGVTYGIALDRDNVSRISNNVFEKGHVGVTGYDVTTLVECNVFRDNQDWMEGAALFYQGAPTVRNNLFLRNAKTTTYGPIVAGAIGCDQSDAVIVNNTLVGNKGPYGGAISITAGRPIIANNIIVEGNTGLYVRISDPILSHNNVFGQTESAFLDITDPTGTNGNIKADPLFVDPVNADYRLQSGSPCRDTGSDTFFTPDTLDFDGRARRMGAHVDMGACEFVVSGGFTMADAATALRAAGGLGATSAGDVQRLRSAAGGGIVLRDAARLVRKAAGLDPNP